METQIENNTNPKRVQLDHLLLDVNFLRKPKILALRYKFGPLAALWLIDIYSLMSMATDAQIDLSVAQGTAIELGIKDPDALIEYCLENTLIEKSTSDNRQITNSRVIKDQESLAKKRRETKERQEKYKAQRANNALLTRDETVISDTVTDTATATATVDINIKKNSQPKPDPVPKKEFAPHVFFTEAEHQKIIQDFGPQFFARVCEKLSAWIEQDATPKRKRNGRNAMATCRVWVFNAVAEEQSRASRATGPPKPEKVGHVENIKNVMREIFEEAQQNEN